MVNESMENTIASDLWNKVKSIVQITLLVGNEGKSGEEELKKAARGVGVGAVRSWNASCNDMIFILFFYCSVAKLNTLFKWNGTFLENASPTVAVTTAAGAFDGWIAHYSREGSWLKYIWLACMRIRVCKRRRLVHAVVN